MFKEVKCRHSNIKKITLKPLRDAKPFLLIRLKLKSSKNKTKHTLVGKSVGMEEQQQQTVVESDLKVS